VFALLYLQCTIAGETETTRPALRRARLNLDISTYIHTDVQVQPAASEYIRALTISRSHGKEK